MRFRTLVVLGWCLPLVALAEDRVASARQRQLPAVRQAFAEAGVAWPPGELYLRALKAERQLEVWAGPKGKPLQRVKTFPFCAASGELGPKREEGDLQVPEGFYTIDLFNPRSQFHLSMRVSYPNALDRLVGRPRLGGNIFVHGDCVSIGCIAIQDAPIEALYVMVTEARAHMGKDVPIHVFPRQLDAAGMDALSRLPDVTPEQQAFWRSLQPAWTLFEQTHRPPATSVDTRARRYIVRRGL
ncbi:L,D-transpeptidase family protein [Myxococcaceae bacterium JPH2]|nr:L,D-transpeptidase family protein [Myxococcaceae bacterium JPH2]